MPANNYIPRGDQQAAAVHTKKHPLNFFTARLQPPYIGHSKLGTTSFSHHLQPRTHFLLDVLPPYRFLCSIRFRCALSHFSSESLTLCARCGGVVVASAPFISVVPLTSHAGTARRSDPFLQRCTTRQPFFVACVVSVFLCNLVYSPSKRNEFAEGAAHA